jgi:hypothetical protein
MLLGLWFATCADLKNEIGDFDCSLITQILTADNGEVGVSERERSFGDQLRLCKADKAVINFALFQAPRPKRQEGLLENLISVC